MLLSYYLFVLPPKRGASCKGTAYASFPSEWVSFRASSPDERVALVRSDFLLWLSLDGVALSTSHIYKENNMKKNHWKVAVIIGFVICVFNILLLSKIDGDVKRLAKANIKETLLGKVSAYQSYQSSNDSTNVLKLKELQIVDGSGNPVIVLSTDEFGNGVIAVNNLMGRLSTVVTASEAGGIVSTISSSDPEAGIAALGIDETGGAVITSNATSTTIQTGSGVGVSNELIIGTAEAMPGFAYLGLDNEGNGALRIAGSEGGYFSAYIDTAGNGIAETHGKGFVPRWSSEQTLKQPGLIGDLDGDGDVDFQDFLLFATNFGKTN